jgi:sigma-54 dependent transcriptional regulator, acetoin dehydrogenase operon transcriptional activator AcoR
MNDRSLTPVVPPSTGEQTQPHRVALLVASSPDAALAGRAFPLIHRLVVGRADAPDINVGVDDAVMSRRHFEISLEGDVVTFKDKSSTNGTWVNGTKTSQAVLEPGSVIRAGSTVFELNDFVLPLPRIGDGEPVIFRSALMSELMAALKRVAPTELPILIEGETGTGKDVIAHAIHAASGRKGPFIAVNCAAIPSELAESSLFGHRKGSFTGALADAMGFWASARDGTLFLDELGELPLPLQPKLLRALETGEFTPVGTSDTLRSNARIVAATNTNLTSARAAGAFRHDLYARLAVYPLNLPPLRDRRGDIPFLFRHFLGAERSLSAELVQQLMLFDWPLNVRQLRALALRMTVDVPSGPLDVRHIPDPAIRTFTIAPEVLDESTLRDLMGAHQGNVAAVASVLSRDRKQVYRWLKRYRLEPEAFRTKEPAKPAE